MKPCAQHRESLALLACAALDAGEAAPVLQHLERCPACREYYRQMTALADEHALAACRLPEAEAAPRLHARIAAAIQQRGRSWQDDLACTLGSSRGRVAGVAFVVLLLAGGLTLVHRLSSPPQVAIRPTPVAPTRMETAEAGSKFSAYRLALSRSPEDLDRLLASEAARSGINPASSLRAGLAGRDTDF